MDRRGRAIDSDAMTWELSDGEKVRGPFSDEDVVLGIERGLDEATLVRRAGETEWAGLRSQPRFAMALERRAPMVVAHAPQPMIKRSHIYIAGGAVLFVVALSTAVLLGRKSQPIATSEPATLSSFAGTTVPVAAVQAEEPVDVLLRAPTLAAAIVITKPQMSDERDKSSAGAIQLGIWAMKRMVWSDVGVTKAETRLALVHKDSDEERGKRMCIGGSIIQIEVEKTSFGKLNEGLLMDDSVELVHFIAVGTSGTLVKGSPARFCGVVTGLYDYENSAGGVGHAVDLVGMFDIPENRKK